MTTFTMVRLSCRKFAGLFHTAELPASAEPRSSLVVPSSSNTIDTSLPSAARNLAVTPVFPVAAPKKSAVANPAMMEHLLLFCATVYALDQSYLFGSLSSPVSP